MDHVSSFFADGVEKNAVWYHPSVITVIEMEKALKNAGAYLGTDMVIDKRTDSATGENPNATTGY